MVTYLLQLRSMASSSNRNMHLGIAAEHARVSTTGIQDNAGIEAVVAQIIDFLTTVAVDFAPRLGPGEVECAVLEMMIKWSDESSDEPLLDPKGLLKHSELFAMMTQDKNGEAKEFLFLEWARRC